MATLETVAASVLADLSIDGHFVLATRWAADRYVDLLTQIKLNQARQIGSLKLPANISSGTISITSGTRTVTGDATAQTAWAAQSLIGWHLRGSRHWYRVEGQTSSTLTLNADYSEDTLSADTYLVRKREFDLPLDVKRLGLFSHPRLTRTFYPQPQDSITLSDAARTQVTGGPYRVSLIGAAPDGGLRIELYPGSDQAETLDYIYWSTPSPTSVAATEPLPTNIDAAQLAEGVKINAYEWKMARAADSGLLELAAFYKNNSDRQRTVWEAFKRKLIRQDGVMDDTTFLTTAATHRQRLDHIQNARDYWLNTPVT